VAVCWSNSNEGSGEISCASYEARAFGVKAGMIIREARRRCPQLVSIPYEFDKYAVTAEAMYRALFSVSPHVQGVSVDEAYVDVTGVPGQPAALAHDLRRRIQVRYGDVGGTTRVFN
jgi:DNA repair protein REV1